MQTLRWTHGDFYGEHNRDSNRNRNLNYNGNDNGNGNGLTTSR